MLVLMLLRRKMYSLNIVQATIFTLLLLFTGIAGAKLLYFFESGMESFSGMSFFGAVYSVLVVMPVLGLVFKLKPADTLDACAPCVAAIIGFQRFGCFCAGCCGGIPIGRLDALWPTQLMEGIGDVLILCLLLHILQQKKNKGRAYPVLLITYGIIRFIIEFVRDTPKDWLGFSHGQWFSVVGICFAIMMIVGVKLWKKKREKKQHELV